MTVRAGGGVVVRTGKNGKEYLLVHRPSYKDWTLPKGKVDSGETVEEAAVREVQEETGFTVKPTGFIGAVGYTIGASRSKAVHYWLMEATGGEFRKNSEVDEIAWLRPKKARRRLSYEIDTGVLVRAQEQLKRPSLGKVFIVRHGYAGVRNRRDPNDYLRSIDETGKKQAGRVASRLAAQPLSALASSPLTRCTQTLEPLAEKLALPILQDRRLAEAATAEDVLELMRDHAGHTLVLCTHGDVIASLVSHLAKRIPLEGKHAWRKGSVWMLETRSGRPRAGRYLGRP